MTVAAAAGEAEGIVVERGRYGGGRGVTLGEAVFVVERQGLHVSDILF